MKKLIVTAIIIFISHFFSFSQSVGIGTTSPHSSSLLDLRSTTRGLLIPRMNTAQKQSIAAPAAGLLVYDTTLHLLSYWTGSAWQQATASTSYWNPSGNNIVAANAGNVGIGLSNPTRARLEVNGEVGYTSAIFGGQGNGISIIANWPGIGYNGYYSSNGGRYMDNGYAGYQSFDPVNGYFAFDIYSLGTKDALVSGGIRGLAIMSNGNVGIGNGVTPGSPLSFPNVLGKKISLWSNGPGSDYGIGLQAERLLIYTGNKIEMGSGDGNAFSNAFTFDATNGNMFSKQTGNLNLVPLGAVSFRVQADNSCSIVTAGTNFTNHAGSLVLSQTSGTPGCGITYMLVESDLYLNPAITSQYSKVIVVGAPMCIHDNAQQLKLLYGQMQGNAQYHIY